MTAQFLTAEKVALIVLLGLYCNGQIPPASTLDILQFITARLIVNANSSKDRNPLDNVVLRLEDFAAPFKVTDEPNKPWNQFLNMLWNLKSVDYLFELFQNLDVYLDGKATVLDENVHDPAQSPPCTLHKMSVFGMFIRLCKVNWEKTTFPAVDALWQSFVAFRSPSATPNREKNAAAEDDPGAFDLSSFNEGSNGMIGQILMREPQIPQSQSEDLMDLGSKTAASLSHDRIADLLSFQIEQMQRLGVRLPHEMREKFSEAIKDLPSNVNIAHYARYAPRPALMTGSPTNWFSFLDAWYAGDFSSSFESLHRYYDYALHGKDRSQYQYALLNMAVLQADFGCFNESLAAMDEAVSASRDNKDMPCLNFALSWLHHFRNVYRAQLDSDIEHSLLGTDAEGLAFLKVKAQENKMWSVLCTALVDEARLYLTKGHEPQSAIIRIIEASEVAKHHSLSSMESALQLIQSSIFSRLGVSTLSKAYCNILSLCYKQDAPFLDHVRARCRMAYTLLLAGEIQESQRIVDDLSNHSHQTLKVHQFTTSYKQLHELHKSVLKNETRISEQFIGPLVSSSNTNIEFRFSASVLSLAHSSQKGNHEKVFTDIEDFLEEANRAEEDVYQTIRLLSLKSRYFAKIGTPQKGFSIAMRAVAAAMTAKILPALWEAVSALAGVLNAIESYREAEELVTSVVYQATETEDLELIAGLWMAAAEASVGTAKSSEHDEASMHTHLRRALVFLEKADSLYTKLGDVAGMIETLEKQVVLLTLLKESREVLKSREKRLKDFFQHA